MDISTFLLLMSLISLHTFHVNGEGFLLMPVELSPIPCTDKAVEKLSRLAVTYINEDRNEGYKFALNRITNVYLHAQGPAGSVYYLDLDVLETKCHIGSPKPWKRCEVRPFMETQVSGSCNTTILQTPEGFTYLYSYECALMPDPPEKLQQTCPTCPVLLSVDSPDAMNAAGITLEAYRRQSTLGVGLGVKKVTRAAVQNVPTKAIFVEYTVQECTEGFTERGTCQRLTLKSDTQTAGFCTGSVYGDLNNYPDVKVSCEMFKIQNVDMVQPVKPQVLDLPTDPVIPTFPPLPDDPVNDLQPIPSHPSTSSATQQAPFDPTAIPSLPSEAPILVNPSAPVLSSSSESEESIVNRQQHTAGTLDSSSEESGALLARRPPFNFRYQRRNRRKRQSLTETTPSHNPVFLSDFPSGPSPFRSCPGPARYATV
ncbi:PREDICTED: fetuin-B-like [Cyprinodon variegatus]|uniref:fetuin-B-like n=1 Tax=Cyprinodon variegatus TaxID=28743 RepID=UPI0007429A7B|nr:PREDICTED: fetuin-B-like [Cyprinodon variegatus]